jgi:hypothetical protein
VVGCATATATAATGEAGADRDRASAAVVPGRDTDRDGLSDRAEVRRYHTDPRRRDTDRDGLSDGDEVRRYHTSPRERDTDRDGFGDRAELRRGTNPRAPTPTGYPDASNTGVPPGTTLTPYTGPSNIKTPNTVIDGRTIGCIEVSAPGVVIRNSRISCSSFSYAVYLDDRLLTDAATPLLIEDSEITCNDRQSGAAVGEADFTVRRVEITHCENGFDIDQHVLIEDSFIHDLYTDSINHMDGAQFGCGHWAPGYSGPSCAAGYAPGVLNVTFRHNTIYAVSASGEFGTSAIISNRTPNIDHNVLIENNLLAGGAFTLYCDQDGATGVNYVVRNNHFSTKFSPKVGFYGISDHCSDETQSGNVIHETGRPLKLR